MHDTLGKIEKLLQLDSDSSEVRTQTHTMQWCESVPTLTLRAGQALGSEAAGSSRRGEQQPDPASGQRLQPAQVLRVAREAPALGAGAVTRTPITGSIKLTIDCVSDANLRVVSVYTRHQSIRGAANPSGRAYRAGGIGGSVQRWHHVASDRHCVELVRAPSDLDR